MLRLGDRERVELAALPVADPVDVGQEHGSAGTEPGRDASCCIVGIDVAYDAVRVAGERRDHRHLTGHEDRVEQVAPKAGHARDETQVRDALRDEQPTVHTAQADRVDSEVTQSGETARC